MGQRIAQTIKRQIGGGHIHVGVRIQRRAQDRLPENCNGTLSLAARKRIASEDVQPIDVVVSG
jgi:hypothetical protein